MRKIARIAIVLGFVIVVGAAGAVDCGISGLRLFATRAVTGVMIALIGAAVEWIIANKRILKKWWRKWKLQLSE